MTPGLDLELDKLQVLFERLAWEYKAKSISVDNTLGPNDTGQLHQLKLLVKSRNSCLISSISFQKQLILFLD